MINNNKEINILKIQLLGGFYIHYQGNTIDIKEYLTKQTMNLFAILLMHYEKGISNNAIFNILWSESENPSSALKFQIFRLRKGLEEIPFLQQTAYINIKNGVYSLHIDLPCEIDLLEVTRYNDGIRRSDSFDEECAVYAQQICELYKQDMYCDPSYFWFSQNLQCYRRIFLEVAIKLCEYFYSESLYSKLRYFSLRMTSFDDSIEDFHYYYLIALYHEKKYMQANEYFLHCKNILINHHNVNLSSNIKNLYDNIVVHNDATSKIENIRQYYQRMNVEKGAYYCNLAVFDHVCEMQIRNGVRKELQYYLFIFEVVTNDDERLTILQEKVRSAIQKSLRQEDIFTKLNKYQHLVLLASPDEQQSHLIAQRICRKFASKVRSKHEKLHYSLEKIEILQNDT